MRKHCINFNIFWINILFASAVRKDTICERCVKIEECPSFAHLNKHEQQVWLEQVPCDGPQQQAASGTTAFGFSPVAKGDYICCPKYNIWKSDSNNELISATDSYNKTEVKPNEITHQNQNSYPSQDYVNQPSDQNIYIPNYQNYQNIYGNQQNGPTGKNTNGNGPNKLYWQNPNYLQYPNGGNVWNGPRQPGVMTVNPGPAQNVWQNPYNRNPYYDSGNEYGRPNSGDQCAAQTSLLPDPETKCCGRDMSDSYRITGGKETELDQFPWTVLLKMTFSNGNSISLFNCGGSLISRQYVLTAGHCVFDPDAKLIGVNVTLAEYDKTTFPRDCKYEIGRKPKCIDNVLMFAEDVIIHPQYDDDQLHNDIALIRLQGHAPYTRYIRPICLPPIDIDNDDLSNLPLAVAGWGRNGKYVSDIKQSTVVHLVPHDQCKKSYPYLSSSHLCAAGRTGQDTCKGDSGGPLMMMFRASYYVIGVVSGKRADSPCGTTVPSLYTNVFHYVPWIRSNIRS